MSRELIRSYTRKDFHIEWYSGQGAGGQKRNKTQNCCRITHIATGLRAQGTEQSNRPANQRTAFTRLANLLVAKDAVIAERRTTSETVRNYHAVRNEVHDKASGLKMLYSDIVGGANISPMIDARRMAMGEGDAA